MEMYLVFIKLDPSNIFVKIFIFLLHFGAAKDIIINVRVIYANSSKQDAPLV